MLKRAIQQLVNLIKNVWKQRFPALFLILVISIAGLVLYWAIRPDGSPEWTGFGAYDEKASGPRAKTLWDWMELLVIPTVLAVGAWWLNKSEKDTEREIAEQRADREREIATDSQRQITLEAYFDRMTDLLLEKGLRISEEDAEVRSIARTRTLAVLRGLDPRRKGQVLRFLYESKLIGKNQVFVNLSGADLSYADLWNVDLSDADLDGVWMCNADLSSTYLEDASLSEANLNGAKLVHARLSKVNLSGATLEEADLSGAYLSEADLYLANLSRANLRIAELPKANLCKANLSGAILRRADLPGAKLVYTDLSNADLNGLNETDLSELRVAGVIGPYRTKALLRGANLEWADLRQANLQGTKLSEDTTLPDGAKWTVDTDMARFTDPEHPDFWRPEKLP